MNLKELVYDVWENPDALDIESDAVWVVENKSEMDDADIDRLVNRIYNATDIYFPNSREWIERVESEIELFEKEGKLDV